MTFSSRFNIAVIRIFQVLMPIFTVATFTKAFPPPADKIAWLIALVAWEWFSYNIVRAFVDADGITYYRWFGTRHVRWDMIRSVLPWKAAGGVVLLTNRSFLLSRYLFLLDSRPGI
ncbi:MAG: PH domain-containing protein, partial [Silvibacterium sp.]